MAKTIRVGLYLRVSTVGQTVENQRLDLQRVAEQRGWVVVGEYIDHGISGAKGREKRPEFDRLCNDAARGKLDLVAAWSIDRLGRSLAHLTTFLGDMQTWNVALYLHQQQVDTTSASGRAFLQMAGVFAEFERAIIVERIKAGLARTDKRLGRPPVDRRTEARIVELRRKGLGILKIARQVGVGTSTVQRVVKAA